MQAREHFQDGVQVVQLSGEIDMRSSPELREILAEHAEQKRAALLLDLSGVEYIDSSGLATMVEYVQRSLTFDGRFGVSGLSERLRTIFDLARLGEVLPIFTSLDEARSALMSPQDPPGRAR
ncbi:MAG: STAS domain-containing protein [Chthoniobacteraceae bacterium]